MSGARSARNLELVRWSRGAGARGGRSRPRAASAAVTTERQRQRQPGLRHRRRPRREAAPARPRGRAGRGKAVGDARRRRLPPGRGRQGLPRPRRRRHPVGPVNVVTGEDAPPNSTAIYNQTLPAGGYGYLTTRDGTKLAVSVRLPGPIEDGPYPTLVEYSGYGYANPAGAESGISPIANLLGYAVVDVNMRGTGCSGGAFDYFERLQAPRRLRRDRDRRAPALGRCTARSAWSASPTAASASSSSARPPAQPRRDHAAVGDRQHRDHALPRRHPQHRLRPRVGRGPRRRRQAGHRRPAGQGWAYDRIQNGDATCAANQVLHTAAADLIGKVHRNRFYRPKVANPLEPVASSSTRSRRPVFLACQFNDEQTGAHCPNLADRFTGTKRKWFTFTNGLHIDSLDPETFNRWFDFLELYVAQRRPELPPAGGGDRSSSTRRAMGVPGVTLPPDPIRDQPTYEAAKAAFESAAAGPHPVRQRRRAARRTTPSPASSSRSSSLPIPGTKPRSWFFGDGRTRCGTRPRRRAAATPSSGTRSRAPPTTSSAPTPAAATSGPPTPATTGSSPRPATPPPTCPRRSPRTTRSSARARVHAWIQAPRSPTWTSRSPSPRSAPTARRPTSRAAGCEPACASSTSAQSTLLEPVLSLRREDAAKLPEGRVREGRRSPSTTRATSTGPAPASASPITAPSGDQPVWSFAETVPSGDANVTVAFSRKHPSRLILPLVPGSQGPDAAAPVPGAARRAVPASSRRRPTPSKCSGPPGPSPG